MANKCGFIFSLLITLSLPSLAQTAEELWPGDASVRGDFSADRILGEVSDATVADGGLYFDADDLESILADLAARVVSLEAGAGGGETATVDAFWYGSVITLPAGSTQLVVEFADWSSSGTTYYDKQFPDGWPIVRNLTGHSHYSDFVELLDGATTGSHRGIRIDFSEATAAENRIAIAGPLTAASGESLADRGGDSDPYISAQPMADRPVLSW